jgi:hypothetical protein
MKHEHNVQYSPFESLGRIQQQYVDLLKSTPFSLEKLFSPEKFQFSDFCREFKAHPESDVLKDVVHEFGEKNDIWLANAKHHVTCALFLYPDAKFDRMVTMMKNLTLGFYLNDVMGRDAFKFLPTEEKVSASEMIEGMSSLNDTLYVPAGSHPLEFLNAEILKEFRDNSPENWFAHFLEIYNYHIGITHTDQNFTSAGNIPSIESYMDRRCHLGGVHHILLWIEYSSGEFLDWELFRAMDLEQKIKRLHWVTAAFAGLSNDLFSFEKEVIDCGSDSNLVMIVALNNPEFSLKEVITVSSKIVKLLLTEVVDLIALLTKEVQRIENDYPVYSLQLRVHLDAIIRCTQAIWMWHCHSKRYKRPNSIWTETSLVGDMSSVSF